MTEPQSKALSATVVALTNNEMLTILEAQQEFEGEQGVVVPAKSIWLNSTHAKRLRDFLIEQYPID